MQVLVLKFPYCSRTCAEMAGCTFNVKLSHLALSDSAGQRQQRSITAINCTMAGFTNPFTDNSEQLYKLVTKAVMPEKVTYDVCQQSKIGSQLFDEFVSNRIQTNKVNLWAPMKKCQLQLWKSRGKRTNIKLDDKLVELKEDRNLFARLVVVAKSRPHINFDEAVGKYKLSVVPRSLFAADGQMLHCSVKSNLVTILESLNA